MFTFTRSKVMVLRLSVVETKCQSRTRLSQWQPLGHLQRQRGLPFLCPCLCRKLPTDTSRRRELGGQRGAYAVRGFDSHDFFEGRFFLGFVEGFAVVEEQVKVFSFLDSDERKVFRKASVKGATKHNEGSNPKTGRASGPANRKTSRRGKFRDGS